ncbi:Zinc protease [Georgfuchsia toluolica]|uniref:Zinc protease n=1 Tax=Georgfuchsia toluolica TaxID=424218 RepID=A0A916N143_9PROT|nr:pitrilysin family protein [Georgfuchsia toluolica]CAG4884528.1 Zinc protease [Georgfuchsia toluolica]
MKKIVFMVLALAAALTTATAQAGVKIAHWVAPSGANVYFVETHDLPMLDVQIDFPAGSAFDPSGKAGTASLAQGMLDSGAGDLDEERLAERIADLGAQLAGSVDNDRAGLSMRMLSSRQERDSALALLQTILVKPAYPEAALTREKARSIAALQEAETRPDAITAKRFAAAIYPNHPYGVSPEVSSIAAITRDDLLAFHRTHYVATRAVVSIIGDVTRGEAEAIALRLTEALPATSPSLDLPPVTLPKAETIRIAHPAAQSHIAIGMPGIRRGDPDYFALLVGNYTLGGGGFVSRLMNEVREKHGYAYDVHSYFMLRKLEGPFQIGLQTKREQAAEALKVANDTLNGFLKSGPTAAELKAAKQNLVDGLALRLDSNAKLLGYLSLIGFYGLPLDYLDTFAAKVNAVTAEQVKAAFTRHVKPENLVTVIVAGD